MENLATSAYYHAGFSGGFSIMIILLFSLRIFQANNIIILKAILGVTGQLINGKLHFDGYIYDKDKISGDLSYWHCRQYFKIRCLARATTTSNPSNSQASVIIIHRARQETRHNHPSILTEVNKSESNLKEIALEIDDVNIDLETTTTPMMIKEESKMEVDDSNLPSKLATKSEKLQNLTDGSELKRSSRLRVKREILVQVSDKYKGSTSAQLIGKHLFINGYIYSARQYAPNLIYWNCRGLKLKSCKATAITSNPITTNTMLMVRRGPEESKHSHPPSPVEVEEAELKAEKFEPKTNQRPPLQVTVVHPRPISRPTSEKISTGVKLEPKRLAPDRKKIESSKPVSNAGVPRLIDRKLCIDDYLYAKERQFPDRVQWKCSRYKKDRCLGRITTSVPSPRGKLIVLRGHDLSKHNHQPGTEDAIKAEKVVVEVEMKNKRNTNRQNTTNIQSSQTLTNTACSKSAEKAGMAKSTKSKLTSALTPRKRVISSTSNTGKPRLVGKKLCIDEYLYYKERQTSDKVHWKCYRYDKDRCRGRVTTSIPSSSGKLIVLGSDGLSKHHHQPSTEDIIKATKVVEVVTKNKRGTKRQKTTNIQHSLTPSNTSRSKSDETSGPAKSSKTKLTSSLTSRKRLTTSKNIQEVKKVGLLGDHRKYQQFLKTFSRNPIFSRENIIAAVKPFYSSNTGRVMAFAAILENREKVEADLKKLKKNPKVVMNQVDIDSLDKNGNGGITDNQESMDAERIEPVIASTGMELADIPPPTVISDHGRMTTRLIGKRLCIDGYICICQPRRYLNHQIQWDCRKCSSRICKAKAVTSNPVTNKILVVYKGPAESPHTHPPSIAEVEQSEMRATQILDGARPALQAVVFQPQSSLLRISNVEGSQKTDFIDDLELRPNDRSAVERSPELPKRRNGPSESVDDMTKCALSRDSVDSKNDVTNIYLIGKRLYIDGYIYSKSSDYGIGKIHWRCKRYWRERCLGRVTTSIPSESEKLTVLKGHDLSKHNHMPCTEDLDEAKELAASELGNRIINHSQKIIDNPSRNPSSKNHKYSASHKSNRKIGVTSSKLKLSCRSVSRRKAIVSKKIQGVKRLGLMNDHRKYQEFLTQFSKRPVFERQNILEALKSTYASRGSRTMAYATVLENREKIELDLKTMKDFSKVMTNSVGSNVSDDVEQKKTVGSTEDGHFLCF
ncbi:hypothetical protein QAD02_006731 [Eretmocerus hayati]|uniref:Uncharacterized protein n=1 Tax=Eretmocerus hayati TaxID=131215 RepID=A0ACC2N201_9HYME|nr:hypothetical protein QAD02_006731 [Eretmocerus hayati]